MTLVFFVSATMVSNRRSLFDTHLVYIRNPLRAPDQGRTFHALSRKVFTSDRFTGRPLEQAIREPVKNANWHLIRRLKIAGIMSKAKEIEEWERPSCKLHFYSRTGW